MRIVPAIDLIDGKCVRLSQGDFEKKTEYSVSPLEIAKDFESRGVRYLHLVDLNGARTGEPKNFSVLEELSQETTLQIDFSGGLRSGESVKAAFKAGAHSVVVGSAAVKNPDEVKLWFESFGHEYFIIGADVRDEKLAISGWEEDTEVKVQDFIQEWIDEGITRFLCTSIAKDGLLSGPDFELYKNLNKAFPEIELIASGGVSSAEDIMQLEEMGIPSAIIGKALYEGKISLDELQGLLC